MNTILILIIIFTISLMIYIRFLDYAREINNRLVRVECASHNNTSNVNNIIDIIEENRVESLKKNNEQKL